MSDQYKLVRSCYYLDKEYKIIGELSSGFLLVVLQEDIDKGEYPLQILTIPSELVTEKY
ncbi:hypothetical protein [Metabacillus sp. FJAT-53654]|uniref:Uncharacterized protein n=1 Tax=Metabacillus rhizosphaerae TaxID=3117747 RepID=A0ABZ2MYW7_9BACI